MRMDIHSRSRSRKRKRKRNRIRTDIRKRAARRAWHKSRLR